eukprot:TRINITY_DN834_c0_g1_i11.p1 TRINITY_DN834_c0_g1~~TRINITY_DN834_c0_g1_i11.p1  ORF type:complete len:153 (+),score=27.18 TRINITY_DN834_c0_g1_i11:178-636(+)
MAWTAVLIGIALIAASSMAVSTEDSFVESTTAIATSSNVLHVGSSGSYDCRSDKSSTPITIEFDNESGKLVRVRGCQNQYSCKPFQDCVVGMAEGAKALVTLDSSFKYFIMTYHGDARDTELYPDANMKYPSSYVIKVPYHPRSQDLHSARA